MDLFKLISSPRRFFYAVFFIYFSMILFIPCLSTADFIIHHWENQFQQQSIINLELNGMYYNSNSNYTSLGQITTPSGFTSYNRTQTDLKLSYGIFGRITFFARGSWEMVSVNSNTLQGIGSGLSDQSFGMTFRLFNHPSKLFNLTKSFFIPSYLDIQIQTDIPGYKQVSSTTTPALGDGSVDSTIGLFATFPFQFEKDYTLQAILGGGYTYRTALFSSAIPWSLSVQYMPKTDGIFFQVAGLGVISLRTDPNGSSSNTIRSNADAGGSAIIGGTNSSIIQLSGKIGYRIFSVLDLFVSAEQSIWGQAAPLGLNLSGGIRLPLGHSSTTPLFKLTPEQLGQANQGFVNYSLDAKVTKTNDRLNLLKINKGTQDGVEIGQAFDIFLLKEDGTTYEPIARGEVIKTQFEESALAISEYYKNITIHEGFIAKRVIK